MNKGIVIGIVALILVVVIGFNISGNNSDSGVDDVVVSDTVVSDSVLDTSDTGSGVGGDGETGVMEEKQADDGSSDDSNNSNGKYIAYSKEAAAQAAEDGNSVIFFHASWCPTCKAAEADFKANMDKIPSNTTILKADYDKETALKTKYGVVMQDTFVQVDANGEMVKKWNSGGQGIKSLLAQVE